MSKKRKKIDRSTYTGDKNVIQQELSVTCTDAMQVFYANTNLMRQISNFVDGLKPVERRILYVMYLLKIFPNKRSVKCAKIVGDVMSDFHPHGDSSIYGTLVKMAQWWSMRHILTSPDGNFGDQAGEPAAAFRYTTSKLTQFAMDAYFEDFDIENAPTKESFDRRFEEPEYLPAKYPMALLLGCFGIGQGIQVSIPSFRPESVFEKALNVLDDPLYNDPLMYPDSPTFCDIIDEGKFEEMCRTGNGQIKYRARADLDYDKNEIIIRAIPPQTNTLSIKEKVIELHEKGVLKGYVDFFIDNDQALSDLSGATGFRIKFKKEIDIASALAILFKQTALQKTLAVNFVYLDNYQEVSYGVIDFLREWIDNRREQKQIMYTKKKIRTYERMHTLETFLMIFDGKNAEKALNVVRTAEDRDEVIKYLMKDFKISSLQATSIANMRISSFTKKYIANAKEEYKVLSKDYERYNKILSSSKQIDKIIRKELEDGMEKYGKEIRSKIITVDGEETISNTRHIVVYTKDGYLKKLPHNSASIGYVEPGDYPVEITVIDNREDLMVFDSTGKIYKVPVSKIPSSELNERGEKAISFIKLKGDVKAIIPKPGVSSIPREGSVFVVMLTKNGIIKKTDALNFVNMRGDLIGMTVDDGDELIGAKVMVGNKEVLVYTDSGMGVRYSTEEVRESGRTAKGVTAITKDDFDEVIGFDIVSEKDKFIFCLTDKGKAKKCTLDNFRTMKRSSKPLRIITLDEGESVKNICTVQGNEDFRIFMKNENLTLNMKEVDILPRMAKGNKVIPVRKGDTIIDIKRIK